MAKVDHPVINERSPVVDANHGRAPIPEVGHAHFRSKRKRAVSRRHRAGLVDLTTGGAVAVKTGAVLTGFAGDDLHNFRYDLQLRLGKFSSWRRNDRSDLSRGERCLELGSLWLSDQIKEVNGLCSVDREEIAGHHR